MIKLIHIELLKLKRSFLTVLLPLTILLPIMLIVIQYLSSGSDKTFFATISTTNIIIPVSIFTVFIILANYVFAREYKGNCDTYIFITPNSRTKILLSKLLVSFIIITFLEVVTFGLLIFIGYLTGSLTIPILIKMLMACLLSSIMYFLLAPAVIFVVLIRRDFISSLLISLVAFMFTCPFVYKGNNYYYLPHLIPVVTVADFIGVNENTTPNYFAVFLILIAVFAVFLSLSIWKFNKKE